jgi:SAM-dependent methyltransferase
MIASVKNFLYDHPEYYELLYPEARDETPAMCRRAFARFLGRAPRSILDIGCGTGRDLRSLRKSCPECVGVDCLSQMIAYARTRFDDIAFHVGDMQTLRLGRTFDALLCLGWVLMYALTDEDLDRTLDTFVAHSHAGSLLVITVRNALALLGDGFQPHVEGEVASAAFHARYVADHTLDRRRQILCRRRTWQMPDGSTAQDFCEYRLVFPHELAYRLTERGFAVLGMYDNRELQESDFTGPEMYTFARFGPQERDQAKR